MATKPTTKYGVFEGKAYYARIFPDNMDNSEYHEKTQGQYNMMFVPKDDETLQAMLALGFPEVSMGNKMVKSLDYADGALGMKLKRPNVHPSGYEGLGGAPVVTKGKTNSPWDFIADGEIGNGSTVAVKISVYGEGSTASVKMERVGIIEHVPFEQGVTADGW